MASESADADAGTEQPVPAVTASDSDRDQTAESGTPVTAERELESDGAIAGRPAAENAGPEATAEDEAEAPEAEEPAQADAGVAAARELSPTPTASPAPTTRFVGRAANDPRDNPRQSADIEIATERLVIDPSTFPPVEPPQSTRPAPPRAANDPRNRRGPADDADESGVRQESIA